MQKHFYFWWDSQPPSSTHADTHIMFVINDFPSADKEILKVYIPIDFCLKMFCNFWMKNKKVKKKKIIRVNTCSKKLTAVHPLNQQISSRDLLRFICIYLFIYFYFYFYFLIPLPFPFSFSFLSIFFLIFTFLFYFIKFQIVIPDNSFLS